jgi:hypothetical protein
MKMSENLKQKIEEMKQLTMELLKGRITWEDQCGYNTGGDLKDFFNLTEELHV